MSTQGDTPPDEFPLPPLRPHNSDLREKSGWEARYQRGETPWDLGGPPPCLVDLLARLDGAPLRVLVPGAGSGHDAIAWARAGHQVTAVDIAPSALALLHEHAAAAGVQVETLEADLFALPSERDASFDAVWEQTCFCAINPDQRADYVLAMVRALRAEGLYYGLFWQHGLDGGPPWNIRPADVRAAFPPHFEILSEEAVALSAGTRSHETLFTMRSASASGKDEASVL
jgi:SAM-dependent methyltransferase